MILKEAPWKTSALNERFRKKRNGEFSTATSGTERERGFVRTFLAVGPSFVKIPHLKTINHKKTRTQKASK